MARTISERADAVWRSVLGAFNGRCRWARKVIAHVESKRFLFSTDSNVVPEHCVDSVLEIRSFLTDRIAKDGVADKLEQPLRLMRRHCLRPLREQRWHMHDDWFGEAFGELRCGLASQIGAIAVASARR